MCVCVCVCVISLFSVFVAQSVFVFVSLCFLRSSFNFILFIFPLCLFTLPPLPPLPPLPRSSHLLASELIAEQDNDTAAVGKRCIVYYAVIESFVRSLQILRDSSQL